MIYVVVEARMPRKRVLVFAVPLTGTPDAPQEIGLGLGAMEERVVGLYVSSDSPLSPDAPSEA